MANVGNMIPEGVEVNQGGPEASAAANGKV